MTCYELTLVVFVSLVVWMPVCAAIVIFRPHIQKLVDSIEAKYFERFKG